MSLVAKMKYACKKRWTASNGRRRNPRTLCGGSNPFEKSLGYQTAYGYQYGTSQTSSSTSKTRKRKGFSIWDFTQDVLIGMVTGGLASAAFYGAGKAVDVLKGSVQNRGSSKATEIVPYYPANDGAIMGTKHTKFLLPGDTIDRFGKTTGKYFSPLGTPLDMRALPYDAKLSQYRQYEVVKPFEVEASTIAPAFDKIGLGIQYRSSVSAKVLEKKGIIKLVGGYW